MSGFHSALMRVFQGFLRRAPLGEDGVARIAARQIYILPTPNGLLYAVSVFVMLLGSLNYQNNLGLLIAFFLTSVGLVAMHHCWYNLLGLEVSVRPGPNVFAGAVAPFEVTLRNARAGPRYDLRATGGLDPVKPVFLDAKDQQVVALGQRAPRRGWLRLGQVEIATRHPMHLFRAWCYAETDARCLVYPRAAATAPPPMPAAGDARRPAQRGGEGVDDYVGSRAYHAGDSPGRLDWKAFARERGLIVKEFGGDEGLDVWVDWDAVVVANLEERLSRLTRQVLDAGQANLRFGLRLPGIELGLATGEAHGQRCLRELALFNQAPE